MSRTTHVVGLLFSEEQRYIVLIHKRRPAWMAGYLCGPGGAVEPCETPLAAMHREAKEEADCQRELPWHLFCHYASAPHGTVIDFFCVTDEVAFRAARTMTDEEIVKMPVSEALFIPARLVPNMLWLIPMALNVLRGHHDRLFFVVEPNEEPRAPSGAWPPATCGCGVALDIGAVHADHCFVAPGQVAVS